MEEKQEASFIRRIVLAVAGLAIVGMGIGMMKRADLGIDPFNGFITGLALQAGISYPLMFVIVTALFFAVTFLLDRNLIGIATVINLFLLGYLVQFTLDILLLVIPHIRLLGRILLLVLGLCLISLGSAFYFTADLGVSAYDALAIIAGRKTPVPFRFCRITTDVICGLISIICGVPFGVGTVIPAFCLGPAIHFCNIRIARPLLYGRGTGES